MGEATQTHTEQKKLIIQYIYQLHWWGHQVSRLQQETEVSSIGSRCYLTAE